MAKRRPRRREEEDLLALLTPQQQGQRAAGQQLRMGVTADLQYIEDELAGGASIEEIEKTFGARRKKLAPQVRRRIAEEKAKVTGKLGAAKAGIREKRFLRYERKGRMARGITAGRGVPGARKLAGAGRLGGVGKLAGSLLLPLLLMGVLGGRRERFGTKKKLTKGLERLKGLGSPETLARREIADFDAAMGSLREIGAQAGTPVLDSLRVMDPELVQSLVQRVYTPIWGRLGQGERLISGTPSSGAQQAQLDQILELALQQETGLGAGIGGMADMTLLRQAMMEEEEGVA